MERQDDRNRIFRLAWRQKALFLFAAGFTVIQCAAQLYLPRMLGRVVDGGILRGNLAGLSRYGVEMLCASLVLAVCGYLAYVCAAAAGERFALELRTTLYETIYGLSIGDVARFGSAGLITRLVSDVRICADLTKVFLQLTLAPLLLLTGGVALVWRQDRRLGLLFLAFALCQVLLMLLFIRKTAPRFQALRELTDRFHRRLQDVFSRLRLVKLAMTERGEAARFQSMNGEMLDTGMSVQRRVSLFQPLVMMLVDLSVAAVLLLAQRQGGRPRLGNVMETIAYTQQILLSIVISGSLFRMLSEAGPSARRIAAVLGAPSTMADGTLPLTGPVSLLEAEDVSFRYPLTGADVFSHLTVSLSRGAFWAVTGATGSGKSTLAGLFVRLWDASGGSVRCNGTELSRFRLADLRRKVALVEKDSTILAATFGENIRFGREWVNQACVRKAAAVAQCAPWIEGLPEGYDSPIASMGRTLSGGERQRLAIARALAGAPDVLILDDSTSALDYRTERALLGDIRRAYPELTILLCTQRAVSAALAERIICLERGGLAGIGSHRELLRSCPAYRALCPDTEGGG